MANFYYKGKNDKSENQKGFVEAENKRQALTILKERGIFCYWLQEKNEGGLFSTFKTITQKVTFSDTVNLTRQLATMINAGLPLTDSLEVLKTQGSPKLSSIVSLILRDVREGMTFSESLKKFPAIFSPVYVALVNAGESAGILDNILNRLADNLDAQREFIAKLKNALIYPIIVVIAMVGVIFGMMVFVMPKLSTIYEEFDAELPQMTRLLISLSKFMAAFWWLFPVFLFLIFYGVKTIGKTKEGRKKIDELKFKIPIYSKLYKKVIIAEFSRTLGLLIGAGVSIVDALKTSSRTANNVIVEEAILKADEQVEKGFPFSSTLAKNPLFPTLVSQMIAVGEETGKLDEVLAKVSRFYQQESEESLKGLTTALEPLIMIVLGVGVLFLILAIIMPIYSLTSQFK